MMNKKNDCTTCPCNLEAQLNAQSFQTLYEFYKDALKIVKNLKKENEQLRLQNSILIEK